MLTSLSPCTVMCFFKEALSLNILEHDSKWHLKILGCIGPPNLLPFLRRLLTFMRLNIWTPVIGSIVLRILLLPIICKVRLILFILLGFVSSSSSSVIPPRATWCLLKRLNYFILRNSVKLWVLRLTEFGINLKVKRVYVEPAILGVLFAPH